MLLTFDWNSDREAFFWLEGLWRYEDSIATVNFVVANAAEVKPGLRLVGVYLLLLDLFGVFVEIKIKGSCLAGRCARGCYLLPFNDHTLVNVENWFWQAWRPKMGEDLQF